MWPFLVFVGMVAVVLVWLVWPDRVTHRYWVQLLPCGCWEITMFTYNKRKNWMKTSVWYRRDTYIQAEPAPERVRAVELRPALS